jgi:RNA polymerase sigma-70 factor (ECF subfamily)
MAGNAEDAEDLTQESFVWAFKNIGSFRAEAAFGTWLYRIASNRCLGELRQRKPRFQSMEDMEEHGVMTLAATGPNPEEQMVRKEVVRRVEAAVAELPESQRIIFVLATQMGMRYREIGDIVGCSEDAVKVRIHRARKRVRDTIRPFTDTELDR